MGKRFARVLHHHMMREGVDYAALAARIPRDLPPMLACGLEDDLPEMLRALARGRNPGTSEFMVVAHALHVAPQDFLRDMYHPRPLLQDGCVPDYVLEEFAPNMAAFISGVISLRLEWGGASRKAH